MLQLAATRRPAAAPRPAATRRAAGRARRAVAAVATGALALPGATACSSAAPPTINSASAARQISTQLATRYQLSPPEVSCPSGIPARKGRTFVCTTTLGGHTLRLKGTVTDGSGRFSIAPAEPILVPASVAGQLTQEITSRTGRTAAVHCPGGPVAVVRVHATLTCTATFAGETPRDVVVTVVDSRGDFGFELAPPS